MGQNGSREKLNADDVNATESAQWNRFRSISISSIASKTRLTSAQRAAADVKQIYWDPYGNLRHGKTERNRESEVIRLMQRDTMDESDPTKLWMIVPSRWLRQWLLFAFVKVSQPPAAVDMWSLLADDERVPGGWRPLATLLPPSNKFAEETPGHYRRISLEAWLELIDMYGVNGYALAVRGTPYDDKSRWRVFKDPRNIDINLLPEPVLPEDEEKAAEQGVLNNVTSAMTSLFGFGGKGKDKDGKDKAAATATTATSSGAGPAKGYKD